MGGARVGAFFSGSLFGLRARGRGDAQEREHRKTAQDFFGGHQDFIGGHHVEDRIKRFAKAHRLDVYTETHPRRFTDFSATFPVTHRNCACNE